ncbi:mitochondrial ribosomal protein L45 isoform X2 [Osmia lignaria lignaria]|uniref:mitochondrial ribosomal protein L45 isoform X2 n=1 Tax=Osmia lignaria lignaria TaxID=1437193 RepID=UPI00402BC398
MISTYKCGVCIFGRCTQNNLPLALAPINYPLYNVTFQQSRSIKKHFNQKYRKERAQKFIKMDLPKYDNDGNISQDKERSMMKKLGILPQRQWTERPILISCTPQIFESYVVPEGDGKFSAISTSGAKQRIELLEKKSKSFLAIRKIRSYDDEFSTKTFGEKAFEIYLKAHEALVAKDDNALLQYITEAAFPIMIHNMEDKTIVWKFLESLEPPRLVHARNTMAERKRVWERVIRTDSHDPWPVLLERINYIVRCSLFTCNFVSDRLLIFHRNVDVFHD